MRPPPHRVSTNHYVWLHNCLIIIHSDEFKMANLPAQTTFANSRQEQNCVVTRTRFRKYRFRNETL